MGWLDGRYVRFRFPISDGGAGASHCPHFIKSGHGILYEFVFERLGMDRAVMDVVESNRKVRRFHAAYGAAPIDAPLRYAEKNSLA